MRLVKNGDIQLKIPQFYSDRLFLMEKYPAVRMAAKARNFAWVPAPVGLGQQVSVRAILS